MVRPSEDVVTEIGAMKDEFVNRAKTLRQSDPHDNYWRELSDPIPLSRDGIFLETGMLIMWLGRTRRPRRILEIGTRTGGSLISLLGEYTPQERAQIQQIVSCDLWQEYIETTGLIASLGKILGSSRARWITEIYRRYFPGRVARAAQKKVLKNLALFGITGVKIRFVSGDSKVSVPDFFARHPMTFDYILVDGAHDEQSAWQDLQNVAPLCEVGGCIVFDDVGPESYRLIGVWDKFKSKHAGEFDFFEIMHRKGMAWAVRRATL